MNRYRKLSTTFARRLLSLVVLLSVCAMLLPFPIAPLPSDSSQKDQSQPFPCQNRPCGCRSAEQCWKKCCCFNNKQKIAWAKANNVVVPDYVLAAAEKEIRTNFLVSSLPVAKSRKNDVSKPKDLCSPCLTKRDGDHCIAGNRVQSYAAAGSATAKCCQSRATAVNEAQPRISSSKWVMAVYSAECQGERPHVCCSIVLVIPSWQGPVPAMPSMIETFSIESERLLSASLRPPVPPPKIGDIGFSA